ncbi:hypothetical protein OPT61_g8475 [Boeremia exigua]|uniref:Uncharacterized protein n=1 Tax=Boeremia exigua TaxID=749465 RepID=A0ACC2HY34_9PLEO|nr:hypothetical protein OPT61_g8475 [Boeremia exigua]
MPNAQLMPQSLEQQRRLHELWRTELVHLAVQPLPHLGDSWTAHRQHHEYQAIMLEATQSCRASAFVRMAAIMCLTQHGKGTTCHSWSTETTQVMATEEWLQGQGYNGTKKSLRQRSWLVLRLEEVRYRLGVSEAVTALLYVGPVWVRTTLHGRQRAGR